MQQFVLKKNLFIFSVALVLFTLVSLLPLISQAQVPGVGSESVTLVASPSTPEPGKEVTVSLDAFSLNTLGSTITWYLDGKEYGAAKNENSITFTAGELGKKHVVRSVLRNKIGVAFEAKLTVPVTKIDLVVEANTYVPSFYRGRPLIAERGEIRAVAVTHTGGAGTPGEYTYEWKLDGSTLFGGPMKGKQVITFTLPLFSDHVLSVLVYDRAGNTLGRGSTRVDPTQPELYFYEENELRGLSRRAVTPDFVLVGDETKIIAEPYFLKTSPFAAEGVFEWSLNGSLVQATGKEPNAITLRHTEGEGSATIACTYLSEKLPPQYVSSSFNIFFK